MSHEKDTSVLTPSFWVLLLFGIVIFMTACGESESQDPCEGAANRTLCFQSLIAEGLSDYEEDAGTGDVSIFLDRRFQSDDFGVDSFESATTWDRLDSCLENRTNRSICNYQLAASIPCVGPPDDIASLVGIFSPEARAAIQVGEQDYEAAVIDLVCEMRRFVIEETHDDLAAADDLDQRLSKLEDYANSESVRTWMDTPEGVEFLDQIAALRRSRIPNVSSIPTRACRIPFLKLRLPC